MAQERWNFKPILNLNSGHSCSGWMPLHLTTWLVQKLCDGCNRQAMGCPLQFAFYELLSCSLSTSRLLFGLFVFLLNDRKQREDNFGIAVILIYFFTKDLVLHFVKTINSNNIINIQLNERKCNLSPLQQHHLISSPVNKFKGFQFSSQTLALLS